MARGPKKPRWFGKKKKRGPGHNANNETNRKIKQRKLNLGRERDFMYDLKEVFKEDGTEEPGILLANILNKASRDGIDDAIEYLDEVEGELLSKEGKRKITQLLKRYSVMR